MAEFASKGVAGTGLGLGIAGTALGVLNGSNNGNGGGILGGLFGNGNGNCAEKLSVLEAELAKEKAERYTDQTVLRSVEKLYNGFRAEDEKIAGVVKQVTDGFLQVGNAVSRLDKEIECIKTTMAKDQEINALKLDKVHAELKGAIALEAERRTAGDNNLYCYVNATFVPGQLVMPLNKLCPSAMPRYNEWQAPDSGTHVTVSQDPSTAK